MELFQKPEPAKPRKTAPALRPATAALNGGLMPNPVTGAIQPDISMSVNNVFAPGSAGFSAEGADLADLPFLYARWTNPTTRALEARLAALEGAEDALTTATGVAAIAATFLGLLKSGDHLILSEVCYAGAFELATPVITRPLDLGVDLVIHSLTKFMNGHGDALGGAVIGRKELISALRARSGVYLGATLSAQNAWLILRGLDTLYPRIRTASANAQRLAGWLEAHPKITRVIYPGLPSHPQHALAQAQMALPGGMSAFQTADPQAMSHQLADRLQIIHYAFSLGHQRSICVLIPTEDIQTSTFRMQGPALARYRDWAGDGLFRLSVGLEDPEDLIEDLARALG